VIEAPTSGAVVMYYGVPRKSVVQEWQKDLFRFLPKGQGELSVTSYLVPIF
jgi:hypothetical protein